MQAPMKVRGRARRRAAAAVLGIGCAAAAVPAGATNWFPVGVETREPPFAADGTLTRVDYVPGDGASHRWRLCATLPGLRFHYFAAVAYGLSAEASRQGVEMRIDDADGFDVKRQRQTVEECLANGYDAILLASAEEGALAALRERALAAGVVVIDMVTGSGAAAASAHIASDAEQVGRAVGANLVERHPLGDDAVPVAWFPGPEGAAFAAGYDEGFRHAIRNSAVMIEKGGFTSLEPARLRGALDSLADAQGLSAVAGVGPIVLEAVKALGPRASQITLVSTGISPEVVAAIEAGDVDSAVNDKPVVQGRIAVDLTVRALEGRPFMADLRPTLELVDRSNVESFDRSTALVPPD